MSAVERALAGALSGRAKQPKTHGVRGTSPRGEQFDLRHFTSRADAVDYAAEVNGAGGSAVFYRL